MLKMQIMLSPRRIYKNLELIISFFLIFILFYWIFYLFTFQMLTGFPISHPEIPYTINLFSSSMRVLPQPTHPLLPPYPGIPLHWSISHSQDLGPLLPLKSNKAILCYSCCWNLGFLVLFGWWFSPWEFWGFCLALLLFLL